MTPAVVRADAAPQTVERRVLEIVRTLVDELGGLKGRVCLPFNPSRYSEDRVRPFVKVVGPWLRGTSLWSPRRKAEEDRGTAWAGRPATYAWRHSPQVGRILRRQPAVAMMEAADKGRLNDSAQVRTVYRSRFRGVLVQGEVRPDAVVVGKVVSQQPTQVGLVEHDHMVEALAA
jgi:hypothetical protein